MSNKLRIDDMCHVSLIVSTYNNPTALRHTLWAMFQQTYQDFEIVIADDGSDELTRDVILEMSKLSPVRIKHIWHPDTGFTKSKILNKAIAVASGERIVVTDGDCVCRNDFLQTHVNAAKKGYFVSGSYFKLPKDVSEKVTFEDITSQRVFTTNWLISAGFKKSYRLIRVSAGPLLAKLLNRVTTARPSWNGHSASCLRSEAIAVNGFNEEMSYGGQDVEFGVRLNFGLGLKGRKIRFSTVALHLDHPHGYASEEVKMQSRAVAQRTIEQRLTKAPVGLDQWLTPNGILTLCNEDRYNEYA